MQIGQTNLWENTVQHGENDRTERAIAAYQTQSKFTASGVQQEQYIRQKTAVTDGTLDMATYADPTKQEEKQTVAEQLAQENGASAESRRNEVAVIANTTSEEDLAKMEEDGFSITESDSHTIITVTDKIKAVLAEAGVDISHMGGGLTTEQLEQITGNPLVAQQITQTLEGYDLPATDENVEDCTQALAQAAAIPQISGETMAYLLKNEKEPSIQNLYLAAHSSSGQSAAIAPEASGIDFDALLPQMEAIAADAGLFEEPQALENSKWLVANQIPLTAENLQKLNDLQTLSDDLQNGSVDWDGILDNMAQTITAGGRPKEASMLTARRRMAETMLAMTSAAAATMEKAGVELDLAPLTQTVETLKEQEKSFYRELLTENGVAPAEETVDLAVQTMDVFEALKQQPSYVLGQIETDDSVGQIYESGARLQSALEAANERYETLMSAPRADLGDSIQKAFSNVDDILTDMGQEPTDANRRAVRILAYNSMPLSEENLTEIKAADAQMQRAFSNMKPAVTLEMIRRGENPLEMDLQQLNTAAEQIRQEIGDGEQERFSKYLWKLEQNNAISEEERSSYIGIYRLIAQVEKTDGAALGFLMKQQSDVTMKNLLSAVRSEKKSGMDYQVDDSFDGVEAQSESPRIDEQISAAYTKTCLQNVLDRVSPDKLAQMGEQKWQSMTPEQLAEALAQLEDSPAEQQAMKSYRQEQLSEYRQALSSSEEIYAYLERYNIPNTMSNIMAASQMLRQPNQMMERLFRQNRGTTSGQEKVAALKQQVLEEFAEALENPSELADAQETLAEVAEHVMDDMIIEDPATRTLDIRAMQQLSAQFALCAKRTEEECYMVPVQTGDSVTGVSLKIVRGKKQKGFVDIFFDTGKNGKISASMQAKDGGISGILATDDEETARQLTEHLEELQTAMREPTELHVVCTPELSFAQFELAGIRRENSMKEQDALAEDKSDSVQTARLYRMAERFIQTSKAVLYETRYE